MIIYTHATILNEDEMVSGNELMKYFVGPYQFKFDNPQRK